MRMEWGKVTLDEYLSGRSKMWSLKGSKGVNARESN